MKYILIYFIFVEGFGGASISQEFDDLDACQFAWEKMYELPLAARLPDDPVTVATCVPKGSAK